MDVASKIKGMKTEIQAKDNEINAVSKRIAELKGLVEEKKKKEARLQELIKQEAELLATLE